jgi:hypothetical protein
MRSSAPDIRSRNLSVTRTNFPAGTVHSTEAVPEFFQPTISFDCISSDTRKTISFILAYPFLTSLTHVFSPRAYRLQKHSNKTTSLNRGVLYSELSYITRRDRLFSHLLDWPLIVSALCLPSFFFCETSFTYNAPRFSF